MATFSYSARSKDGQIVNGTVDKQSRDDAASSLIEQGLTPINVSQLGSENILMKIASFSLISLTEKVLFSQELATLVNAGVPISQSLAMLEKQTKNKRFKGVIGELAKDVEGGITLASALGKHPDVFSPLFISMVNSGEIGGTLDKSLNELSEQMTKDRELIAKVRGAMIYPSVIFVGMVGALIFMLVTIIPKLQDMFNQLGGDLPASTKSLIFLSKAFTDYGLITLSLIAGIVFGFRYLLKNVSAFRKFIHTLTLKIPVVGDLITKLNVARMCRTLSSLLSSGVSVVEALQIIGNSTQNMLFKETILKTAEKVGNGGNIADTLKTAKIFPALVPQMISVGEETGSTDVILGKIADFYDSDIDNITKNLSTLLEPLIMILIGLMVGYVIIAIITPIYSMTNMI
jgi:type IV pilus assembly protein PilC